MLTGATGVMGMAGLRELMRYPERYDVTVLARASKINRKKLAEFEEQGVKVIWGDLLDEKSMRQGIENADIVLHVGGMVSPMADYFPDQTLKVNVGSMKILAKIVREIEDNDPNRKIGVVYIGSVSQYGSKLPPNHWGKVGDKLKAARQDAYAVSKIIAERVMLEAGLRKWVSIRQTAILHSGLLKNASNPVTFHVPIKGALEWISTEDSGRMLERVCREEVPDSFWNHFYNLGGGEAFRLINLEFERSLLKALGCPSPEKVFDTKWFATNNFHGIWFEDSDLLEEILHYRDIETFHEALDRLRKNLPWYFKLTPLAPSGLIKAMMKRVASKEGLGPLSWLTNDDKMKIEAFWGSREDYQKIPDWENLKLEEYDRRTPKSTKMKDKGERLVPRNEGYRKIRCKKNHEYMMSSALEEGGHGCPYCLFEESQVESPDF